MMLVTGRKASATLSLGASLGTLAATLLLATPAFAQEPPSPQSPNANSTGAAAAQTPVAQPADPTPDAQANPDPTATPAEGDGGGEEIVVTGIRASLAKSAAIKRESTLIVDSVSAEDIGKLPDVSIADALARLPGVTAQRVEGRDQSLSIRGLGPDFSTTLLNGREQVTVGDNRGVEFDQYPAEFFANVNVYKSADASLIAAGVSGTVDLRMLRPLSMPSDLLVVSARGQMNDIGKRNPDGERFGYRATGTFVHKFADDTLGVAFGLAAQESPTNYDKFDAWGYPNPTNSGNCAATAASPCLLGGVKPYVQTNMLKRYGGVATIEWQPSDRFHSTFDALYTHFTETQRLRGIEIPLGFNIFQGGGVLSNAVVADGFVQSFTFSPQYTVQRNDLNSRKADSFSFGWNNDLLLTDTIHLNVDAAWSRAKRKDDRIETYSGTGYNGTGTRDVIRVTRRNDGLYNLTPTIDYTNTNVIRITDPGGWGFNGTTGVVQAGFRNEPEFKDDLKSLRASLNGEFGFDSVLHGWEVGGNYSRRKKEADFQSFFYCPAGGDGTCRPTTTPTSIAVPSSVVLSNSADLNFIGIPNILTLNPRGVLSLLQPVFDNRPASLARVWDVTENVTTGYAKLVFNGLAGGKNLKGAIGVQVIHTKQSSTGRLSGLNAGAVTVSNVSDDNSYTDILPSATMSVELIPNGFIKMGASRTMVRPRLDQERISQEVNINPGNVGRGPLQNSPFSSNGGNIQLEPYKSLNIDLSAEKYFRGGGYVALSGYYKRLTDYVNPSNNLPFDFSSLLSSLTPAQQAIVTGQGAQIGLISIPQNNGEGEIMGGEATASMPFKTFATALDGFGVFASASYTHSNVSFDTDPTTDQTIPGLSKWVLNGTAYFEKWGFQARATYRYRTSFLGETFGIATQRETISVKPEGILDAQIGYEFQDGPLQGLAILAQAKNLTDEHFISFLNGDRRQIDRDERYGRDYYIGITYKF